MTDEALVDVQLLGVPLDLRARSQQHSDELLREMTLVSLQVEEGEGETLPLRLTQLAADVQTNYSAFTTRPDEELDAAAARGEQLLERVVYHVPASVGPLARHICEVLDEVERFCREGTYLLSLAAPPDIRAYRDWVLDEFIRQVDGQPPRSWPDYAAERGLA